MFKNEEFDEKLIICADESHCGLVKAKQAVASKAQSSLETKLACKFQNYS